MMTLKELSDLVNDWQFNADSYPALKELPEQYHAHFALNHVVQHQIKAINRVVALLEDDEHLPLRVIATGDQKAALFQAVWRMQVNVLKLAQVAAIEPTEIESAIQQWAGKEPL